MSKKFQNRVSRCLWKHNDSKNGNFGVFWPVWLPNDHHRGPHRNSSEPAVRSSQLCCNTRNFLTLVNTTAIAYHQNPEVLVEFLPICNSSCAHKRQEITSTVEAFSPGG